MQTVTSDDGTRIAYENTALYRANNERAYPL